MTLDAEVTVHGAPGLKFTLDSETKWAVYDEDLTQEENGAEVGAAVIFVYEVAAADEDTDGVEVPANDTDARTQFVNPDSEALLDEDGNEIEDRFEVLHNVTRWAQVTHQAHYHHDGLAADSDHAVDATDPLIEVDFGTVNNALGATLTFWNIPNDEGDLTWRADVTSDGDDQDGWEGTNMGADNTIAEGDIPDLGESIERTVNLASGCTAGSYTMEVTATVDGEEVAEASQTFQINLSWSAGD